MYVSRPVLQVFVLPSLSVTSKAPMSEGFTSARSKSSVSGRQMAGAPAVLSHTT